MNVSKGKLIESSIKIFLVNKHIYKHNMGTNTDHFTPRVLRVQGTKGGWSIFRCWKKNIITNSYFIFFLCLYVFEGIPIADFIIFLEFLKKFFSHFIKKNNLTIKWEKEKP